MRVFAFVFVFVLGSSVQTLAYDLLEVYQSSVKNSPEYKSSERERELTALFQDFAISSRLPNVSFNSFLGRATVTDTGSNLVNTATINASMPLYSSVLSYESDVARLQSNFGKTIFQEFESQFMKKIVTKYFDFLSAQAIHSSSLAQLDLLKQHLEMVKLKQEVGLASNIDFLDIQSRHQQAKVSLLRSNHQLQKSQAELFQWFTPAKSDSIAKVSDNKLIEFDIYSSQEWVDKALNNNIQLLQARYELDLARLNYQQANHSALPKLTLDAAAKWNDISNNPEKIESSIGLSFALPIYTGGKLSLNKEQAKIEVIAKEKRLENIISDVTLNINQIFNSLLLVRQEVEAMGAALTSANELYEARQVAFDEGSASNIDLLEAVTNKLKTQADFHHTRHQYIISYAKLLATSGNFAFSDLIKLNKFLSN